MFFHGFSYYPPSTRHSPKFPPFINLNEPNHPQIRLIKVENIWAVYQSFEEKHVRGSSYGARLLGLGLRFSSVPSSKLTWKAT